MTTHAAHKVQPISIKSHAGHIRAKSKQIEATQVNNKSENNCSICYPIHCPNKNVSYKGILNNIIKI